MPTGFSWIEKPHVAALAQPDKAEDMNWLRQQGIDVLITLTEDPLPRSWVNDAGLLSVHIPVFDMAAPTVRQLELAVETISRSNRVGMGVAVHCRAGKGRTGTVLAAYFVSRGLVAEQAIRKVRELRPGSIETDDQEQAVIDLASRRATNSPPL
jgi:atypical dual specificity phosphatase